MTFRCGQDVLFQIHSLWEKQAGHSCDTYHHFWHPRMCLGRITGSYLGVIPSHSGIKSSSGRGKDLIPIGCLWMNSHLWVKVHTLDGVCVCVAAKMNKAACNVWITPAWESPVEHRISRWLISFVSFIQNAYSNTWVFHHITSAFAFNSVVQAYPYKFILYKTKHPAGYQNISTDILDSGKKTLQTT